MEEDMNIDMGGGRQRAVRVNYPANSARSKEQEEKKAQKKVEKVVEGEVVRRKKGLMDRFTHTFFSEDSGTVMQYIVMDVLLPAFRNLVYDTISQGTERVLYGEGRQASRRGYTNYGKMSERNASREPMSRRARAVHDFDDVVIPTRAEAEQVIENLRILVDQYDQATVADFYDLVGETGEFTDNKWGWTDLRTASVRPIRGGYLLSLPRTQPVS